MALTIGILSAKLASATSRKPFVYIKQVAWPPFHQVIGKGPAWRTSALQRKTEAALLHYFQHYSITLRFIYQNKRTRNASGAIYATFWRWMNTSSLLAIWNLNAFFLQHLCSQTAELPWISSSQIAMSSTHSAVPMEEAQELLVEVPEAWQLFSLNCLALFQRSIWETRWNHMDEI